MKLSLWLAGLAVRDFFFSHIVLAIVAVAVVVPIVVAVVVPGGLGLVRTALGAMLRFLLATAVGNAVLAALVAALIAWEARGALDSSIELRRQLVAQQEAARAALADAQAKAAAAAALAAQARKEAEDQRAVAAAAADRSRAAEAARDDLAEQVSDYADRLAQAKPVKGCRHRFVLSPADAADLARIGAAKGSLP